LLSRSAALLKPALIRENKVYAHFPPITGKSRSRYQRCLSRLSPAALCVMAPPSRNPKSHQSFGQTPAFADAAKYLRLTAIFLTP
jgi:hypothetical protein